MIFIKADIYRGSSAASSLKLEIGIMHWFKFGLVPWSTSQAAIENESMFVQCEPQTWEVNQEDEYFKAILGYIVSPKTDQSI